MHFIVVQAWSETESARNTNSTLENIFGIIEQKDFSFKNWQMEILFKKMNGEGVPKSSINDNLKAVMKNDPRTSENL